MTTPSQLLPVTALVALTTLACTGKDDSDASDGTEATGGTGGTDGTTGVFGTNRPPHSTWRGHAVVQNHSDDCIVYWDLTSTETRCADCTLALEASLTVNATNTTCTDAADTSGKLRFVNMSIYGDYGGVYWNDDDWGYARFVDRNLYWGRPRGGPVGDYYGQAIVVDDDAR